MRRPASPFQFRNESNRCVSAKEVNRDRICGEAGFLAAGLGQRDDQGRRRCRAIDKAKVAAKHAMESRVMPESIDTDRRREGLIAYVDRLDPDRRECIAENVPFDDDYIHGTLHDFVRRVAAMPTGEPEPTTGDLGSWRALTGEARRLLGSDGFVGRR
jgi:hypothetical protein